ncbi:hypothetical protein GOP47_0000010 [Adiantum capillus-veneris]|uniref:Uncharacterized protein n=1 Tax=Adiantum capillus-veneris TaxID=13818 RepID=A0A9D4VDW2_ADICA|nr:hypothetical protein GOP47_0000010 [Adiantum capillus-veneris]
MGQLVLRPPPPPPPSSMLACLLTKVKPHETRSFLDIDLGGHIFTTLQDPTAQARLHLINTASSTQKLACRLDNQKAAVQHCRNMSLMHGGIPHIHSNKRGRHTNE